MNLIYMSSSPAEKKKQFHKSQVMKQSLRLLATSVFPMKGLLLILVESIFTIRFKGCSEQFCAAEFQFSIKIAID